MSNQLEKAFLNNHAVKRTELLSQQFEFPLDNFSNGPTVILYAMSLNTKEDNNSKLKFFKLLNTSHISVQICFW